MSLTQAFLMSDGSLRAGKSSLGSNADLSIDNYIDRYLASQMIGKQRFQLLHK